MKNIQKIVIAGAGIMGSSIAQIFAKNGLDVVLYDIAEQQLEKSRELINLNQDTLIKQNALTLDESKIIKSRIDFSCNPACFASTDFVLEAILENLEIKHKFWQMVCEYVGDDVILTSNTSGLSITKIAESVKNPQRFCGFHWVNPPHLVPLVEIIKGDATSDETLESVKSLAISIKKKPVLVKKDAPGFILNRIQFAVLREAMHIVESGIGSIEDVDSVLKYGLGMRYAALGPFEIADLGGLDTFRLISSYLFADLSDEKHTPNMLADIVDAGDLGVKTGKGFYDYSNGKDKETIKKRDESFIKLAKVLYE